LAFLTIDLGSSELKVASYDMDGACLTAASMEIEGVHIDGSRAELDPESLWRAVAKGIRAVSRQSKEPLQGACISSHGESFVPLDRQGRALGNVILNVDSRAEREMTEFAEAFGRDSLYQQTGLPPHPMYTLVKIAWLRKNLPHLFAQVGRFVCLEDYIQHRLGIEPAISSPLASRTLGLDVHLNQWADRLLNFAGISSSLLSPVQPSSTAVGTAAPAVAQELGLPPGVVWCSGGHDQACCVIGAGAQGPGSVADGTGTFECMSIPLPSPLVTQTTLAANLPCERHAVSGMFLTLAYGPGGIALKWLRGLWGNAEGASTTAGGRSAYERLLEDLPAQPTGLFFFPYLLGTGTPWMDSHARGAILGTTSKTSMRDLVKAAMEGVSYQMRWNLEILQGIGIPIDRIFAVGGGAKSEAWLQLKADIFQRPVIAVPGEASSRGAAICAAVGLGAYRNWQEAIAAMVKPGRVFEPRIAVQAVYCELFEQYKELGSRLFGHQSPAVAARPAQRS
jgi:xylulokinase